MFRFRRVSRGAIHSAHAACSEEQGSRMDRVSRLLTRASSGGRPGYLIKRSMGTVSRRNRKHLSATICKKSSFRFDHSRATNSTVGVWMTLHGIRPLPPIPPLLSCFATPGVESSARG
jgi:hypothetical protein